MNKKFLSAILFGAMLATSAGTFVSCKDYDDDIKGLQTQIDTNKTAIAELQKLVGAGNWVTSVAASGENLVVTMSNGTSATIAGIKGADGKDGVDGKNAAEWTISEDGFWCKDGEKTANVAVAQNGKDGKNGATAPSPTISDNGMWVVYSWDAAKGEFVAEETEIPAAGTSAYAVKANGIYTLYIADADGEMQEIALPATCDAIVVEAPYKHVNVEFEVATWNMSSTDAKSDAGKALLAKYPEIADIAKNTPMKQGGMLPLIVTPAAVELTDAFTFSLQNVDGTVADIALSAPVKGADMVWADATCETIVSRSAEEAGLWSLEMTPAYDKKKYAAPHYASTSGKASLVVENEKGTVVRTAFAYTVAPTVIASDVEIVATNEEIPYAESIDLFAQYYKNGVLKNAPISFRKDYNNHYVIALANALEAERYGLSIAEDGHTLNIAKMPESELGITVHLTVVALGLNGSVVTTPVTFTIGQEIAASEGLTPAEVTLNKKNQLVTWKFEELGLSAVAFENFYNGNNITLTATREADKNNDGEAEKYIAFDGIVNKTTTAVAEEVMFFNAKGKQTKYTAVSGTWSNGQPETFGFYVDADTKTESTSTVYAQEGWTEGVYTVTLKSMKGTNTVVYAVQTELTVKNPELTADYVKLVPAFVENGVYQITGAINANNQVYYAIDNALITANGADAVSYIDLDHAEYVENGGDIEDKEEFAAHNWIPTAAAASANVYANTWTYEPEDLTEESTWIKAVDNQLYETRRVRAMIKLFNDDNLVPFDFEIVFKSEIYNEDPTKVFTLAELSATFGDATPTDKVEDNTIDLVNLVTKAVYAAGTDKGKAYNLFNLKNGTSTTGGGDTYDFRFIVGGGVSEYFTIKGADRYVVDKDDKRIEIDPADYQKFGLTYDEAIKAEEAGLKFYLTQNGMRVTTYKTVTYTNQWGQRVEQEVEDHVYAVKGLTEIYNIWWNYYLANGNLATGMTAEIIEAAGHTDEVTLYNNYVVAKKGVVVKKSGTIDGTTTDTFATEMATALSSVTFEFVEPTEVDRYFKSTPFTDGKYTYTGATIDAKAGKGIKLVTKDETDTNLPTGSVTVEMIMTVTCDWGMEMKVPFEITLKTVK